MKNDGFRFDVAYTCTRCCDCPDFRERYDDHPYCANFNGNGRIEDALRNDCYDSIHEDCPHRLENS